MLMTFRIVLACLIALSIPIVCCAETPELLSKYYSIEKPDGAGPFPTVIMVPGCSGFHGNFQKEYYNSVQKRLVESGFATLRVSSMAARNESNCREGFVYTAYGANDIYIALEYLLKQPFVKNGAVNIIGWSWGGGAALLALSHAKDEKAIPINAVVSYSPICGRVQKWDSEVPVLVLGASLDNICPFTQCESLFNSLPKRNKLTVKIYDGAYHGFWNFQLPAKKEGEFGTKGYNEAAAKSAWLEVTNFLRK